MKKVLPRIVGFWLNIVALIAPRAAGRRGFLLFCTPVAHAVKPYHRAFFDTAQRSMFEFEEISIQTYRWGNGPKQVLFVHGWQSHTFRWKNYLDVFIKDGGFTVHALDAPAHGLSGGKYINLPLYSRVIQHFIGRLGGVDAVISHSLGSFAMLHALSHNKTLQVGRLVVMGTPGEVSEFLAFYRQVLGLSERAMQQVMMYFEKVIHHPPDYFSAAKFASDLSLPGLIVHDRQDPEAPYRYAQAIHAVWKNSTLLMTEGLGHNLKSGEVMKTVMDFVAGKT